MPQIAQLAETYASQIFWLLVTFGAVFFVIGLGMVPRVQSTVAARDGQIAGDLAAAQEARAAADAAEEQYRRGQDSGRADAMAVTAAAKASGATASEQRLAEADVATAERVGAAEARIRSAADAAMGDIEAVAADAARQLVATLSGVQVSEAEAARAARQAMAHG